GGQQAAPEDRVQVSGEGCVSQQHGADSFAGTAGGGRPPAGRPVLQLAGLDEGGQRVAVLAVPVAERTQAGTTVAGGLIEVDVVDVAALDLLQREGPAPIGSDLFQPVEEGLGADEQAQDALAAPRPVGQPAAAFGLDPPARLGIPSPFRN